MIFDEILQILNGNLREFFETAATLKKFLKFEQEIPYYVGVTKLDYFDLYQLYKNGYF